MKKVVGFLVALVAVLGLSFVNADTASADGAISATEQKILDELNAGATIGGKQFYIDATDINAAENHLKRVALTEAQVSEANKNIQAARALVQSQTVDTSGVNTAAGALRLLPRSVISQVQNYFIAAGNAVGLKITFGQGGSYSAVMITDASGNPVYQTGSVVKNTGADYTLSAITFSSLIIAAAGAIFLSRKGKVA